MHTEAYEWVRRYATDRPVTVLDLGGRVINGSPRYLWPNATVYRTVDIRPGPGVDVVADAADWQPDAEYDVVVCCETFEHAERWREICQTAFRACRPGGRLILTMAGPGRPPHSGIDGEWTLHDGEYYGNVDPAELWKVLSAAGFHRIFVDQQPHPADVRAAAIRPNVPAAPLPESLTLQR